MKNKLSYLICLTTTLIPALSSATVTTSQTSTENKSFFAGIKQYVIPIATSVAGVAVGIMAHIFYIKKYSNQSPLTKEEYANCFKSIIRTIKDIDNADAKQKMREFQNANNVQSYTTIVLWEVLQNNKALFQPILDNPDFKSIKEAVEKNDRTAFIDLEQQSAKFDHTKSILDDFRTELGSIQREGILAYADLKKCTEITKGSAASLPEFQTCNKLSDLCSRGCSRIDKYAFSERLSNISQNCLAILTAIGTNPSQLQEQIKNFANKTSNIEFNAALDIAFDIMHDAAQQ